MKTSHHSFVSQHKKPLSIVLVVFIAAVIAATTIALIFVYKPSKKDKDAQWYHDKFINSLKAENIKNHMEYYSSIPHIAGSWEDHQQAQYTLQQMQSFGLDARIEEYSVMLSYPSSRLVEMISPTYFNCTLEEAVVDDGTSGNKDAIATWNGYSAAGEATGELVYVNYGRKEDYDAIANISLV